MMVVKLNMILITSPELADFRRRLKNLDSKDGQMLFSSLYRSWCHNAVAAFALCLLAQAYEHASNVLQILWVVESARHRTADPDSAELELTVPLLVQIDKLVMLIESPVFTSRFYAINSPLTLQTSAFNSWSPTSTPTCPSAFTVF